MNELDWWQDDDSAGLTDDDCDEGFGEHVDREVVKIYENIRGGEDE